MAEKKPRKVAMLIHVDPTVRKTIEKMAKDDNRTISNMSEVLLKQTLDEANREGKAA